ncbi:putative CheA signal transduction histidine kinase [Anaeromyxobacter sp. K]|uniref:DUF6982 domain-containing protein n=1 Tax=Anaeromyxobacter sp. (strain K) TaxID=447217 RepID=UPI00015F9D1E|nr:hypothetical protein [Anaeromyxobacter sp. K]ACG71314.1 putative CheA signal transduction histidine kinase [Anaeromyxobacter sp. K]
MPDPRSALKEFRQLDRKRLSEGLTAEEERRHAELRDLVEPELQASGSGFDVGAAADRLRASLEPAGLRRAPAEAPPAPPAAEAGPAPLFEDVAPDAGLAEAFEGQAFEALEVPAPDAPAWEAAAQPAAPEAAEGWAPEAPASDPDAAQAWDPSAQPFDPNAAQAWDPTAQPYDPNAAQAWDPSAQPFDPDAAQAWDPNAQPFDPDAAQAWDPNAQPFDPNAAQAWDPSAQPSDPNAAQAWDPNAQPFDPNAAQAWDPNAQPYDPNAAQAWDPNAQPFDPNAAQAWDPNAQPFDPSAAQAWDPNAQPYDPNAAQAWDPNAQPYDPNAAQAWDPNAPPFDPSAAQGWDPSAAASDPSAAQAWDPGAQPYDPDAAQPAWNPDTTATFGEPEPQPSPGAAPAEAAPGYEAWTTPADEPETVDLATEAVIEELEPLSADGLALEGDPSAEPPAPLAGGDAASLPPDGWEVTAPPPDAPEAAVLGEYDEAGAAPAALSPEDLGAEPAPEPAAPGAPLELGEYDDTSGFAAPVGEDVLELATPGAAPAAEPGWAEEVALDQGFELESGGSFDAAAEATVPEWAREAGLPPWDAPAPAAVDALDAGSLGLDGDVEAPVEPAAEPVALGDETGEPGEDGEPIALEPTLDLGAPVEPTLELAELEEPAAGEAGASPGDDPFALRAPEPEPTGARDLSALDFAAGELGEDADAWAAAETAPAEPEPFTLGDVGPQAEPLAGPDPEAELPAWDAGAAPALELEPSRWDEAAAVDPVGGEAGIAVAEPSALLAEAAEALPPLELDGPAAPEPVADAEPAVDAAASLTAAAGTLLDAGAEAPPAIDDLLGDTLPAAPEADATEVAEVADLAAMPTPDADDLPTLDGEDILEEIPADELVPLPPDEEAGGGIELGEVSLAAPVSAPAPAPAPEPASEPEPPAAPALPAPAAAIPDPAFEPLPVEEVSFTPPPVEAAPAPAGAWQVPGAHRVVIHTLEGLVKRGLIEDAALDAPALDVVAQGPLPERIPTDKVKAIFFMLAPGEAAPAPEGKRVRVTFRDGRQVAGFSPDYREDGPGFFMIPADTRTSTARIWIYRSAVRQVAVS